MKLLNVKKGRGKFCVVSLSANKTAVCCDPGKKKGQKNRHRFYTEYARQRWDIYL